MAETQTTEDRLLGERIVLTQPKHGFRANADTLLLAAAVTPGARLLEAGCGSGGALLAVAARLPQTHFVGIERDGEAAALARHNVIANGAQAEIVEGDILDRRLPLGVFDGAFCNPPFDKPGNGRPPAPERAAAHIAEAPIEDWVKALADRLTGGAALTLIHRADALAEILSALEGRLGGTAVRPIHPQEHAPAHRILVRTVKGSRAPLRLLPGLILHENGRFTPQAEAIFRDAAAIPWD